MAASLEKFLFQKKRDKARLKKVEEKPELAEKCYQFSFYS